MALAVRQVASNHVAAAGGTTTAVTFGSATLAGSLLVAVMGTGATGTTTVITAPTSTHTETWTALEGGSIKQTAWMEAWYVQNAVGGDTVYTFNRSTTGQISATIVEVTGAATASVLDQSKHTNGTTTTATTGATAATSAATDEIYVALFFATVATPTTEAWSGITGSPGTFVMQGSGDSSVGTSGDNAATAIATQIVSPGASNTPSASITLSNTPLGTIGVMAVFKAPASATDPFPAGYGYPQSMVLRTPTYIRTPR